MYVSCFFSLARVECVRNVCSPYVNTYTHSTLTSRSGPTNIQPYGRGNSGKSSNLLSGTEQYTHTAEKKSQLFITIFVVLVHYFCRALSYFSFFLHLISYLSFIYWVTTKPTKKPRTTSFLRKFAIYLNLTLHMPLPNFWWTSESTEWLFGRSTH